MSNIKHVDVKEEVLDPIRKFYRRVLTRVARICCARKPTPVLFTIVMWADQKSRATGSRVVACMRKVVSIPRASPVVHRTWLIDIHIGSLGQLGGVVAFVHVLNHEFDRSRTIILRRELQAVGIRSQRMKIA